MTTTQLSEHVRVAAIMPFFRYAVGPTSQHSPAIPYFTFKGAKTCFAYMVRELPWCGCILYKRAWRGLVTACEYIPNHIRLCSKCGCYLWAPDAIKSRDCGHHYCAKASKQDRDEGCDELPSVACGTMEDDNYDIKTGSGNSRDTQRRNHHPTVKPTDLMRYLCRLVTPPRGIILDPFMGSGSTGKAAIREGFAFIGIERDPESFALARARLANELAQPRLL